MLRDHVRMHERSRIHKDPHAVELGRRGGLRGGRARAQRLTSEERSAIASHAAQKRWQRVPRARRRATDRSPARDRIMRAARDEFARAGVAGARIERIARAAGVNKRSIGYHFGGKTGLAREFLRLSTGVTMKIAVTTPAPSLSDELLLWEEVVRTKAAWVRFSMWEALESDSNWVASRERRHFWRGAVRLIEQQQCRGELPRNVDAAQLQLTLLSIVMFPYLLPQMTRFVTGMRAGSEEFMCARQTFLRAFAELLTP